MGINYVDNAAGRGAELDSEGRALSQSVRQLEHERDLYLERNRMVREGFEADFRARLDAAFESLYQMTVATLDCTDEELNATELTPRANDVVHRIRLTAEAFHALNEAAKATLDELHNESGGIVVWETQLSGVRQSIMKFRDFVGHDLEAVCRIQDDYSREYENADREFHECDQKIRQWNELNFLEKTLVENAEERYGSGRNNAEETRNRLRQPLDHLRELRAKMEQVAHDMDSILNEMRTAFDGAQADQHRVSSARSAATEVYAKTCELEQFLVNREIELSVEAAVRQILQIVHCATEAVDSEGHARRFKALIMREVVQKYGEQRAEELMPTASGEVSRA